MNGPQNIDICQAWQWHTVVVSWWIFWFIQTLQVCSYMLMFWVHSQNFVRIIICNHTFCRNSLLCCYAMLIGKWLEVSKDCTAFSFRVKQCKRCILDCLNLKLSQFHICLCVNMEDYYMHWCRHLSVYKTGFLLYCTIHVQGSHPLLFIAERLCVTV